MKKCTKCRIKKHLSMFVKTPQNSDGYSGDCAPCRKEYRVRHRLKNLESIRAKDRERSCEKDKESRRKYREKHNARRCLQKAVKSGKISRPPTCEKCKKECFTNGHHKDYSKPLDVMWLCDSCHGLEHARLNKYQLRSE